MTVFRSFQLSNGEFFFCSMTTAVSNSMSSAYFRIPNFGQDIRTLDRVSELLAGCPNFWQGVRTSGRVSELRLGSPNFGQGVRTLGRLSELWAGCPNF